MLTDATARQRYEAIFRVINRRSLIGLLFCFAATAAVVGVYVLWLAGPLALALIDLGLPRWLIPGLQSAVFLVGAVTLPNLAQLIVIRGDTAAAFEGFNALALCEAERWKRDGVPIRAIRKADLVIPWLTEHPEARGPLRVRLLAWAGAPELARLELAQMPVVTAFDAFEEALLTAMVDFVETGSGDLRPASDALAHVPAEDYDRARLALAFEQARSEHYAGRPWQGPLEVARREVAIPRGATILGRFLSGWRVSSGIVVAGALLASVIALLR